MNDVLIHKNNLPNATTGVIRDDIGTLAWYVEGKLHRDNDLPAIIYLNGSKSWYKNGCPHRENKPAVEYADGDIEWWLDGLRHCETGPALIYTNSNGTRKEWYIHGNKITEEEFNDYITKKPFKDLLEADLVIHEATNNLKKSKI